MADGGGKAAAAARPIIAAESTVRLLLGIREKQWPQRRVLEIVTVNGEPGICVRDEGRVTSVMSIETDGARITAVYAVLNPDKLEQAHIRM
ncbi:MAG: hypothetical protein HYX27_06235 [Acidobacteria bacterium]|nr:hypothetical protein [Acidobacteriota bacterium]